MSERVQNGIPLDGCKLKPPRVSKELSRGGIGFQPFDTNAGSVDSAQIAGYVGFLQRNVFVVAGVLKRFADAAKVAVGFF